MDESEKTEEDKMKDFVRKLASYRGHGPKKPTGTETTSGGGTILAKSENSKHFSFF